MPSSRLTGFEVMARPLYFRRTRTVLATLYIAAGFGLFLSVADNSLSKSGTLPLPPTVAALIFLGSIISFVIFTDLLRGEKSTQIGLILRSNGPVIIPFGLLAFISLAQALHPTAYWGDGRKWIYLQTYDFCIFMAAMLLPAVEAIRQRFRLYAIVGLLTILGSIWYEVQNPGTFSSVPNRAAGFPGNSNWGALAIVMICSASLSYREGKTRTVDLIVLAITGLGLYFTLSRSGTLNFILLMGFFATCAVLTGRDRARTALLMAGAFTLLVTFFLIVVPLASQSSELMGGGSKAQNRLLALADGDVEDDGSAADRMEAARETIDKIDDSPVFGHGTGFNRTMRQTPHNLYLKLWVDSGIIGLLTWLALLVSAFWMFTARRYRPGQALVLVTLFGGLFSHNILEQRTFLILFGCCSSMSLFESAKAVKKRVVYANVIEGAVREETQAPVLARQIG